MKTLSWCHDKFIVANNLQNIRRVLPLAPADQQDPPPGPDNVGNGPATGESLTVSFLGTTDHRVVPPSKKHSGLKPKGLSANFVSGVNPA